MAGPDRIPRRLLIAASAIAAVVVTQVASAQVPDEGTFKAHWSLDGKQESVEIEGAVVSSYRTRGKVGVKRSDGLATEFESTCVGVSERETGSVVRCTWTDGDDDDLYLLFVSRIVGHMGTVREAEGRVIAGTGKYKHLTGWIKTDFLFWESVLEEGKIVARDMNTEGGWKRRAPGSTDLERDP
jgi:hypothetical protein